MCQRRGMLRLFEVRARVARGRVVSGLCMERSQFWRVKLVLERLLVMELEVVMVNRGLVLCERRGILVLVVGVRRT